jgi:hypothetical protein
MSRHFADLELVQWEFDELVQWATWHVISGITSGQTLRVSMHAVVDVACRWRMERDQLSKGKKS